MHAHACVCVYMLIICFVNSTLVIHPYPGWYTAYTLAITGNMYNVMKNETINQCLWTPNNENLLGILSYRNSQILLLLLLLRKTTETDLSPVWLFLCNNIDKYDLTPFWLFLRKTTEKFGLTLILLFLFKIINMSSDPSLMILTETIETWSDLGLTILMPSNR